MIFSNIIKHSVLPKKWKLTMVEIFSIIMVLLYVSAFILNVSTLFLKDFPNKHYILLSVSIVEIVVTVFSVVVSLIATHISNYVNNACIKLVEEINRHNEPMFSNNSFDEFSKKTKEKLTSINNIRNTIFVVFAFYFISSFCCYVFSQSSLLQLLTGLIGAISTIFTVILALISSISCFVTGKYTQVILKTLDENNKKLTDKYNSLKIEMSYINNSKTT